MREVEKARDDQKEYTEKQPSELKKKKKNHKKQNKTKKNLIDTWAKENGIEWIYYIPYQTSASGKIKW